MTNEPRFLPHDEIGDAVRTLMEGGDLRCAVAFWGDGAGKALFGRGVTRTARILCDITMGGTRPQALKNLGAPANARLRHVRGLHAKAYLSDRGAIIGSANASQGGIGFLRRAKLTEAATFHPATSLIHGQAAAWFDRLWKDAERVDEAALEPARRARERAAPRPAPTPSVSVDPRSLIVAVLADPDRFRGVGIVFTSDDATEESRDETAEALIHRDRDLHLLSPSQRKAIRKWHVGDVFSEWTPQDNAASPGIFVCAHRNRRGTIGYYLYLREHALVLQGGRGMVLATRRARMLRSKLGFARGLAAMATFDAPRLERCFAAVGGEGHHLAENATKLARLLDKAVAPNDEANGG